MKNKSKLIISLIVAQLNSISLATHLSNNLASDGEDNLAKAM
jgi:hypothetical protein